MGPGGYESLPPAVTSYLTEGDVAAMVDGGLHIHTGATPPDIVGETRSRGVDIYYRLFEEADGAASRAP